MNTNQVKRLLEDFYDGTTSQQEELMLLNYFNNENVADELLEERDVFLELKKSHNINEPKNLEMDLNLLIDNLAKEESGKKKQLPRRITLWSAVAASVAILLVAGITLKDFQYTDNNEVAKVNKTVTPQVSASEYMEAENAMLLLSYNFNKGMKQLDEVANGLDKTNEILNNTFNRNNN